MLVIKESQGLVNADKDQLSELSDESVEFSEKEDGEWSEPEEEFGPYTPREDEERIVVELKKGENGVETRRVYKKICIDCGAEGMIRRGHRPRLYQKKNVRKRAKVRAKVRAKKRIETNAKKRIETNAKKRKQSKRRRTAKTGGIPARRYHGQRKRLKNRVGDGMSYESSSSANARTVTTEPRGTCLFGSRISSIG